MSLQNIKYLIDALFSQEDKYEIKEIKKEIISIVISYKKDEEITIEELCEEFCNVNQVNKKDLFKNIRTREIREISEPRQAFAFLAHKIYKFTSPKTGLLLNRNHSTILHNCNAVQNQYKYYKKWLVVWETEIENYFRN